MIQQPQQGQQFQGFKPSGMEKIANAMGFQGNIKDFQKFLDDNPDRQTEMMRYQDVAREMARGGVVRMQEGGTPDKAFDTKQGLTLAPAKTISDITSERMTTPAIPTGGVTKPAMTRDEAGAYISPDVGNVTGSVSSPTTFASTEKADQVTETPIATVDPEKVEPDVKDVVDTLQAAQANPDDKRLEIEAEEQTKSSVSDLDAAKGTGIFLNNPVQRKLETDPVTGESEIISGVADAEKASKFTEQIQAATATPSEKATVQGQLAGLTANFDATDPPAWAAGAIRGIQAVMQQRGIGASSIAGQALVQAAMESALPIAQADAQVTASFEAQNLSNRQQRAMLAAEQRAKFMGMEFDQAFQARVQNSARIADVANMNFNAEQQIALENSRIANTMELTNLSNKQALIMAEAGALSNLDMANLSNRQQTDLFKTQQRIQGLFTDQAAENAAQQFNASSQNQTDQFFANLGTQVSQFNATQANAQNQYNAGQANTVARFNSELQNQRDQFNAQNQSVIAQANAQWRRQIATADTAAINRANEINATNVLDISKTAYDNLWQYYSDAMEYAWESADNELDRQNAIARARIAADADITAAELKRDAEDTRNIGSFVFEVLTSWF